MSGRSEWRAGWPVVAGAALAIGAGPGLYQNLSSLLVPGISAEFGWTRGEIATAAGVGLVGALLFPLFGRAVDRLGARVVMLFGMLVLAASYLLLAGLAGKLWQYQLLTLGVALSVPGTGTLVWGKLIAARFVAARGAALAVATSGLPVTTLLFAPALGWAIAAWGWRGGALLLAALVAGVALPLSLLAIRGVPDRPVAPLEGAAGSEPPPVGPTAREARRSGRFWYLAGSAALINVATVGLVTQLVPFGLDRGLGPTEAPWLLTAYGLSQLVGRLGMGVLIDRVSPQRAAAAVALVSAAAFAGLLLGAAELPTLFALVFLAGLMNGADQDLLPFFAARLFGLRAYGELFGTVLTVALLGTALGIVGFGRLHDATGGYAVALGIACAGLVITAGLFLGLREPERAMERAASDPI